MTGCTSLNFFWIFSVPDRFCHDPGEELEFSTRSPKFGQDCNLSSSSVHLEQSGWEIETPRLLSNSGAALFRGPHLHGLRGPVPPKDAAPDWDTAVDSPLPPVRQLLQVGNRLLCSMFLLLSALFILVSCALALLDSLGHSVGFSFLSWIIISFWKSLWASPACPPAISHTVGSCRTQVSHVAPFNSPRHSLPLPQSLFHSSYKKAKHPDILTSFKCSSLLHRSYTVLLSPQYNL